MESEYKYNDGKPMHPCLYDRDDKQYVSFAPVEAIYRNGLVTNAREYNLVYCVTDDKWFGDVVKSGSWEDIETDEAIAIAKENGMEQVAHDVVQKNKNDKPSLSEEVQDAMSAGKDLNQTVDNHKKSPQAR